MRYAIVIEKAESNYAAYVPDLPGCVATGFTLEETEQQIREAIDLHLRGMREDGLPIPEPSSSVDYIEIAASSLFQHRANPDDDQINYCYDDGHLDEHHGQANQKSKNAERDAGSRQHQRHADRQHKQRQQNNSDHSQNVLCLFHFPKPLSRPFPGFFYRSFMPASIYDRVTINVPSIPGVPEMSALHAIRNSEVAAFENPAIEQLKIDLPLHFVKKRDARAEQHRMNVEDDFINQVGFEQTLR